MPVAHESTEYPLQDADRANTSRLLAAGKVGGQINVARFHYTTTSGTDEVSTDTVLLGKLPVGAIVIPQLSSASTLADIGTTVTFDVGQASNTDAFADGIAVSAVGQVAFCSGTVPSGAIADEPMLTEDIYVTFDTISSITAGVVIAFVIAYTVPKG